MIFYMQVTKFLKDWLLTGTASLQGKLDCVSTKKKIELTSSRFLGQQLISPVKLKHSVLCHLQYLGLSTRGHGSSVGRVSFKVSQLGSNPSNGIWWLEIILVAPFVGEHGNKCAVRGKKQNEKCLLLFGEFHLRCGSLLLMSGSLRKRLDKNFPAQIFETFLSTETISGRQK